MARRAPAVVLVLSLVLGILPAHTSGGSWAGGRSWAVGVHDVVATAEGDALGAAAQGRTAGDDPVAADGHSAPTVRTGTASTYGPGWEGWIAWPAGPGWKLRVCGSGGCEVVVSTDAGPDRAMQRAGRILDLDVATFERVAGVSWTAGLAKVSVTVLGKVDVAGRLDPES